MAEIMAEMADMALAPKIMADGSHPCEHCHAQPSVMRELAGIESSIGALLSASVFMKLLQEKFGQSNIGLKHWTRILFWK